jgi:hypothetical protein
MRRTPINLLLTSGLHLSSNVKQTGHKGSFGLGRGISGNVLACGATTFEGEGVEAERRQVTILSTEMVDFTAFSERSGVEAAFTFVRSNLMDGAVRAQGSVV